MRIDVITIFPDFVSQALDYSIIGRAKTEGKVDIGVCDLRNFAVDKRRTVDDAPFGGGAGMVLKPEPLFSAVESLATDRSSVILMSPQGKTLNQAIARELSARPHLILICGHYEGFDERVREHLVDEEISVGDYVLTGGELPALTLIDCTVRLLPGVLGNADSLSSETFEDSLLEYPQYTRPAVYRGWSVPEVLLSGHHAQVATWRRERQEQRTLERRPDLWRKFIEDKQKTVLD
jgi:tRNA (guanine37-N1)-methyltransferase